MIIMYFNGFYCIIKNLAMMVISSSQTISFLLCFTQAVLKLKILLVSAF